MFWYILCSEMLTRVLKVNIVHEGKGNLFIYAHFPAFNERLENRVAVSNLPMC